MSSELILRLVLESHPVRIPALARIETVGAEVTSFADDDPIFDKAHGKNGLLLLMYQYYLANLPPQNARTNITLKEPVKEVERLNSAVRKQAQWLTSIFQGCDPEKYLQPRVLRGLPTVTTKDLFAAEVVTVAPKGLVSPSTREDVEAVLQKLLTPSSMPALQLLATRGSREWEISGRGDEMPLSYGDSVVIKTEIPHGHQALVIWISEGGNSYQLYPSTSKALGKVTADLSTLGSKSHTTLIIPSGPGFQIDTRNGKEACILLTRMKGFSPQNIADTLLAVEKELRESKEYNAAFQPRAALAFYSPDFDGGRHDIRDDERLGPPLVVGPWLKKILRAVSPDKAAGVMLVVPVISR